MVLRWAEPDRGWGVVNKGGHSPLPRRSLSAAADSSNTKNKE